MSRLRLALLALLLATGTVLGGGLLASHPATLLGRAVAGLVDSVRASLPWDRAPSLGDERSLGQALAKRAAAAYGSATPWQRYLGDLTAHLAELTERRLSYRVFVAPGSARVVALPGGGVVMGDQVLRHLQTEAELVALLAEAVGHVDLGHALDAARSALAADGLDAPGLALPPSAVDRLFTALSTHDYAADEEAAADDYAFDSLTTMGYDPLALGTALTRVGSVAPSPALAAREEQAVTRGRRWLAEHDGARTYMGSANFARQRPRWEKDYLAEYRQ